MAIMERLGSEFKADDALPAGSTVYDSVEELSDPSVAEKLFPATSPEEAARFQHWLNTASFSGSAGVRGATGFGSLTATKPETW